MSALNPFLQDRSQGRCELCAAASNLAALAVPPGSASDPTRAVVACPACLEQFEGRAPLEAGRWSGLRDSIWSEHAAVQVASWRLLRRLRGEAWAAELLEQVWLDDDVRAWAEAAPTDVEETPAEVLARVLDSYGAELGEGDSVTLIKDLDVKGAGFIAKRGTLVKSIHLTDDPALVEGRVNGTVIVLKTCFLKKA
jgi:protein PhnA